MLGETGKTDENDVRKSVKRASIKVGGQLELGAVCSIYQLATMPTVKTLREQAKSYGLRGYTPLRKFDLIKRIAEARAPVFKERVQRSPPP
jgi:hypothetical protein